MRHTRLEDLDRLTPLLADLRRLPELKEKTPGAFYRGTKAFLHFHEDAGNLFADLRDGADFARFPVTTESERKTFMKAVRAELSKTEASKKQKR